MKHELLNSLSKGDLAELMILSRQSLSCNNLNDFKMMVSGLQQLFYFENADCAQVHMIDLLEKKEKPTVHMCNISFPDEYLDLYFKGEHYFTDAVYFNFITHLSPVNWHDVDLQCNFSYPSSLLAIEYNIKDGWTHGTFDPVSLDTIVFYIGGPTIENNIRSKKILEHIIPFFAAAFKGILSQSKKPVPQLTKREVEVLKWIQMGKNSWNISEKLSCSKRTIDFHVNNIKCKLNAATRAQAVAIGLHSGIIKF